MKKTREKEEIKSEDIKENNINTSTLKSNADDSKVNKILELLCKCALIIVMCCLIFLFIAAISHTAHFWNDSVSQYHEGLYYEKDNIFLNGILVCVFILIVNLISKIFSKLDKRVLLIISLLLITVLGLWWVNFVKAPIKSDQWAVFNAAKAFSNNDFAATKDKGYFYMHPLQYGCVLGMEFLIRLIKNSEDITFQMINCFFIAASIFLIFKITNKIYKDDKTDRIVYILAMCMLVIPLFSVVVYGNIFGMFFSFLAIFFLLKFYENYKIRYMILITLSMMIAIIFKSNYEIVLIAIIISLLVDLIKKFNAKVLLLICCILIGFSISYPMVYKIVEIRSGEKVNEGIPMITYIAMSIQKPISRNSGWYHDLNNVETIYPGAGFDEEKTKEISIGIIKERLREFKADPKMLIKFYQDKICSSWIEPAYQTLWWSEPLEVFIFQPEEYKEYILNNELLLSILHGEAHDIIDSFLDIVQITVFLMSIISIINGIKKGTYNHTNFVLLITFVGGFLFHILWETKAIYVLPFYIMLIPSAADGICITSSKIYDLIKIRKLKNVSDKTIKEGN